MEGKDECGGSKDLPPDQQRCIRDGSRGWRCKEWKLQDKMYCQKHINWGSTGKGKITKPTEERDAKRVGETEETYFTEGQEVEVTSVDEGFECAWFTATIIKPLNIKTKKILVEYNALLDQKNQSVPLRETVDPCMVRPLPPSLPKCSFHEFQIVDALHNDGWWKGRIIRVFENSSYLVNFSDWEEDKNCGSQELRVHQDWVDGTWVFPQDVVSSILDDNAKVTDQGQQTQASKRKRQTRQSLPNSYKQKKKLTSSALSDTFPTASGTINEHLSPNSCGKISPSFPDCEIQPSICDNTNLSCDEIYQEKEVVQDQRMELIKTTRQLEEMALEPLEEDTRCRNPCREVANQVQTNTSNFKELMVMEGAPSLPVDSSPIGVSPPNQLALGFSNAIENGGNDLALLEYVSLPFEKTYDVWGTLEKWNVFRSMPQHPHFQSLSKKNEYLREGEAIGYILSFAAMAEKVSKLQHDDPASHTEEYVKTLQSFEDMGFEVELIRSRLEKLLSMKAKLALFYGELNQVEEKTIEENLQLEHVKVKAYENNEKKREIEEAIAKLKEKRQILVTEKQTKHSAAIIMQKTLQDIQEEVCRVDADFSRVAARPW